MRDLKEAGVQDRHLSESEPSVRRPGSGEVPLITEARYSPRNPGRREGRWAMTEASSLPGEGPSIPGRCNYDTLSPKRRGDVIRDGTGACR